MNQPKTLAEFRAMLDARAPYAKAISDAVRAGDVAACGKAQQAMREAFPRSEWKTANAALEPEQDK